jgi:DNA-binding winged helix-turn-helix (wHTH) protein
VKRVGLLREAIGDDAEHPRYVSVVRGRGYRLIPPVEIDLPGPAMEAGDIEAAGASSRRKVALFAVALTVVVAVTAGIAFSSRTGEPMVTQLRFRPRGLPRRLRR